MDKLLVELGAVCSEYQDKAFRNLSCKRIQCDEIWSFVGAKERNVPAEKRGQGRGDVWTWVAICPDTKLVPCWFVGNRDGEAAYHFMHDLAGRMANRIQMTTDGFRPYLGAVEDAFGSGIDYAQLIKITEADVRSHFTQGEAKNSSFALDKGIIHQIIDPVIPADEKLLSFNF